MTKEELKQEIKATKTIISMYEDNYGNISNETAYSYRMGELNILEQWLEDLENKENK